MIGLGTNALVRYLVEDDDAQTARAAALIESTETGEGPLFVSPSARHRGAGPKIVAPSRETRTATRSRGGLGSSGSQRAKRAS